MGLQLAAIQHLTKAVEAQLTAQRETNRLLWAIATQQDPREVTGQPIQPNVPQAYERKKKRGMFGPKY